MKIKSIKLKGSRAINNSVSEDAASFGPDANYADMPRADLAEINVFIGRNGAGKSTYIDSIRLLSDPDLLSTLKPDVLGAKSFHGTDIILLNDTCVHLQFENEGARQIVLRHFDDEFGRRIIDEAYLRISGRLIVKSELDKARRFNAKLAMKIQYWSGPSQANCDSNFIEGLNLLNKDLLGADEFRGINCVNGRFELLEIKFSDEFNGCQTVSVSELPSGWRAAAGLIGWARQAPDGSILLIEEPETHLHPILQRRVAQELAKLQNEKSLQLVVATHSASFINLQNWKSERVSDIPLAIFSINGKDVNGIAKEDSKAYSAALTDIGANVSDLLQSNSTIWVEGPSDRIYINFWLERFSQECGVRAVEENVDYSFCLYGGSTLSHFDADSSILGKDLIKMLKINRHSFVVVDRDLDFRVLDGLETRTRETSAKYSAVDALPDSHWITSGYTMEAYLPDSYFTDGIVEMKNQRLVANKVKVGLAREYVKDMRSKPFADLFSSFMTPEIAIKRLHAFILAANK